MIEIEHLTKEYGQHKGVFDLSFSVPRGQTTGFIGANGAGKTTTIRHLMGFLHADAGYAYIDGKDCFQEADAIQRMVGYLPGEINFMDSMNGKQFVEFMIEMKQIQHQKRVQELIDYFELDLQVRIKKMSKGMKQKLGLIIAFMQDASVLILDEPTSGLDPLMQKKFVDLIQKEKQKGKTILMSSHMFDEIEHTCDRIVLIKEGTIRMDAPIQEIQARRNKHYDIDFASLKEALDFTKKYPQAQREENKVHLLWNQEIQSLLEELSSYQILDLHIYDQSLEEVFLQYYQGGQS